MTKHICIRFYEELNDFLPSDQSGTGFTHELKQTRSVKDLIESIGVPHTEIDLITVNGEVVGFDHLVQDGEHISVYPVFRRLDISTLKRCQPEPLSETRFVLDAHLGRLAAYLRMLGFDSLYRNDYDDPVLADTSASEHRILLTCDRQLLMRKQVSYGYFVRARQPQQQLLEILTRFDLIHQLKPFTRCMHCNGTTQPVKKIAIETQLQPRTKKYYNEFFQCQACKRIYWKGSHYLKMQVMINRIKATEVLPSSV